MKFFESIFDLGFHYVLIIIIIGIYLFQFHDLAPVLNESQIVLEKFWFLLPDFAVFIMLRLFSFSLVLSLILIASVLLLTNRMMNVRKKMNEPFETAKTEVENIDKNIPAPIVNEKWERVIVHINSNNPSDWKLAILECDIMLGEILENMGYLQESIGEKLKVIEPSDFSNIENAWEAHKIRNAIAHEGSDFLINEREAKRVIGLYETVFREFECI